MALTPSTRLGPYEVLGPLGAGGMGEVYRAKDTTLGRDVAVKVLPEHLAHDPERLARFEREAKTLASLNHPHIAQIHGFEHAVPSTIAGQPGAGPAVKDHAMEQAIENGRNQATLRMGDVGEIIIRNSRRPASAEASARPAPASATPAAAAAPAAATGQPARPPITGVVNHISYGITPWDTEGVKAEQG